MTQYALAEHFDSSRQAVSKHIKILSECNLLKQKQNGREIHYQLNPIKFKEVDKWLEPFKTNWENKFNQLDKILINLKK
jgi:DNA-binding MarR family transcriptional regulator